MTGRDDTPRIHVSHRLLRARDWQDRPQFGRLCDWWRGGFGGVCALVGIGGAGKTAIADRFVRSLPGVLPTPDVAVDATLAAPRGLHALSVDLLGGYVARFLDGDQRRLIAGLLACPGHP